MNQQQTVDELITEFLEDQTLPDPEIFPQIFFYKAKLFKYYKDQQKPKEKETINYV